MIAIVAVVVGIVVIGGLIFGISQIMGGDDPDPTPTAEPTTAEPTTAEPTEEPTDDPTTDPEPTSSGDLLALGDEATVGVWTVSVHDPVWDETEEIVADGNDEPPAGTQYVYIYATVTNNSDETLEVFDELQMAYFDIDQQQYDGSQAVAPDDAFFLDPVDPGEQVSGTYIFEVPTSDGQDGVFAIGVPNDANEVAYYALN